MQGLVFLDSQNAILKENLLTRILEGKREYCDLKFSDFDDVRFRLAVDKATPNIAKVNVGLNSWAILRAAGGRDKLNAVFPGMTTDPDAGYDVALEFDMDKLADPNDFLEQISDVKKLIIGAPMEAAFKALLAGKVTDTVTKRVEVRGDHVIYVCPKVDRVVVIINVGFNEATDKSLSRIFLQEFVEAKRAVTGASVPNVSFSKEPPTELASFAIGNTDSSGFLLFQFESRTVTGPGVLDAAVHLLVGFRAYLLYHIKATKTYLHMRMRKRVSGWLQVLNRAKPESAEPKEKKSITGKTLSTTSANEKVGF